MRVLSFVAVVVLLFGRARVAEAGHADLIARMFRVEPADIVDAQGFALPQGAGFGKVVVGTWKLSGNARRSGILLLQCIQDGCRVSETITLGVGQASVRGVVDLGGAPGSLEVDHRQRAGLGDYATLPGAPRRLVEGALVIQTEEADGTRVLHLISLRAKLPQPGARIVLSEPLAAPGHGGGNLEQTFELVRGKGKLLEVSSSLQRGLPDGSGCIKPAPWVRRWQLVKGKYVGTPDQPPPGDGCH